MGSGRLSAVCGLVCLLISIHILEAAGQAIGFPEIPASGPSFDRAWLPAGLAGQKDLWSAASFHVGWLTTPNQIRAGYDGLVPPGACASSVFVYPLTGIQVGGSLPIRIADRYAARLYGSYLIPNNPKANQEITWTDRPRGIREWRHSSSQWYKIGGEMLYRMSGQAAVVGGFRLDSLLTSFSDPDPNYFFTATWMEAQTTLTFYEPYVGIRVQQSSGPGSLSLQVVGFPFLFATIQHFNTCDNSGVPFAHTGNRNATRGFFFEVSGEYRLGLSQGIEAAGFLEWTVCQGRVLMTIERHEGGANPNVTDATVHWSHYISSLVVGAKVEMAWGLPF